MDALNFITLNPNCLNNHHQSLDLYDAVHRQLPRTRLPHHCLLLMSSKFGHSEDTLPSRVSNVMDVSILHPPIRLQRVLDPVGYSIFSMALPRGWLAA
jgi:hypothetical protein